eukprot:CAMPEP_0197897224 /NCGR_PEP_ID=MMETSP1439-20131203/42022_1 /TAXON_ID=66791 /ORGANISM="Gonyaulax spinifera, Strain CCMP409" /LENGTH=62 /DNA_ID=CAMNT_0043517843 /DNA_START=713 /DNA_END=897 /DNA_ORIENTATION=+
MLSRPGGSSTLVTGGVVCMLFAPSTFTAAMVALSLRGMAAPGGDAGGAWLERATCLEPGASR